MHENKSAKYLMQLLQSKRTWLKFDYEIFSKMLSNLGNANIKKEVK